MKSRRCWFVGGMTVVIATALVAGGGRAVAAMPDGQRGDGVVDIHVGGRDLIIHTDGSVVNGFILTSDAGLLAGEPYAGGVGLFVTDNDWMLADQFGYALTGLHDLGRALAIETDLTALGADLTLAYTLEGQAGVVTGTIMLAAPGDADLDGLIGYGDLSRMIDAFGAQAGAVWVDGDFTGDGAVSGRDYIVLKSNFGSGAVLAPPASADGAAPEPASLAILAAGAAIAHLAGPTRRTNRAPAKPQNSRTQKRSKR